MQIEDSYFVITDDEIEQIVFNFDEDGSYTNAIIIPKNCNVVFASSKTDPWFDKFDDNELFILGYKE